MNYVQIYNWYVALKWEPLRKSFFFPANFGVDWEQYLESTKSNMI